MRRANYKLVMNTSMYLVLQDIGPWDQYPTVTNDAEHVVEEAMSELGRRRLFYFDSDSELTELRIEAGKFCGFAPATTQDLLKLDRAAELARARDAWPSAYPHD